GTLLLLNYWVLYGGAGPGSEGLDTTALRGGPAFLLPGRLDWWCGGTTDNRARVMFDLGAYGTVRQHGAGSSVAVQLIAKIRPTSSIELSFIPFYEHLIDDTQYLDTIDDPAAPF